MSEWNASAYNRISLLQEVMAEEEIGRLSLTGSERLLDVGCGDGKVTDEIAALLPRGSALGVDPSHNMIAFAAEHFAAPRRPNLRFEVADARRLPYRDEFDVVVSFNALHWVREQADALRSIRAALKPGGRALLRFVPQAPGTALEYVIEDVRQSPRWAVHFAGFQQPFAHFTPDEYRALAEQSGLLVEQIRVEDRSWDFQTSETFTGFCQGTFVEWTRCVPEADRPAYIADVLARYRTAIGSPPGAENIFRFQQMEVVLRRGK